MAEKSPIKSGWRGHLNGHVDGMDDTKIQVATIQVVLGYADAWALCNLLTEKALEENSYIEEHQRKALASLGAALGRLIDHMSANNGGRDLLK